MRRGAGGTAVLSHVHATVQHTQEGMSYTKGDLRK